MECEGGLGQGTLGRGTGLAEAAATAERHPISSRPLASAETDARPAPHLAHVGGKVKIDEAGHQAALACLKRSPTQAVPHQRHLHQKGDDKGGQQAAHAHIETPGVLAFCRAMHRNKPNALHPQCSGGWEA